MSRERPPTDRSSAGTRYHLAILGGAPAGVLAATIAAQRGKRVALVLAERTGPPAPEPTALGEQIRRLQARWGELPPAEVPRAPKLDVFLGHPRFVRPDAVEAGDRLIAFRKALIATGGRPAIGEISGAEHTDCLAPENLATLAELPTRLAVIGSGATACQWAQAFAGLGSEVHLIDCEAALLAGEDPQAASLVGERLLKDGVRMYLGCHGLVIETTGNLRGVVMQRADKKEKLLVDRVLLCRPRRPNLDGLDLETAGVAATEQGIIVGDRLQTSRGNIFAAGEVCGAEFADPATVRATARLAVDNALGLFPRRLSRLVVPRCTHTHPAMAQVGLTPRIAAPCGIELYTLRADLGEVDASIPRRRREGFMAVHLRRGRWSARIVGGTVVAEDADELIAPLVLLIARRCSPAALAEVIPCRPGRMELFARLAERWSATRNESP